MTLYNVQCTVYNVHCILYTVYTIVYNLGKWRRYHYKYSLEDVNLMKVYNVLQCTLYNSRRRVTIHMWGDIDIM